MNEDWSAKKEYMYQNLPTSLDFRQMDNITYMNNLCKCWDAATEVAVNSKVDKSLDFVKRDPKSILQEDEIYFIWGAGNGMEGAMQDAYQAGFNRAKPRWIPVTELKPDREGWFAVKTESPSTFDKGYFNKTLGRFEDVHYSKVTYWMELPR
jgi:hypothetical protein